MGEFVDEACVCGQNLLLLVARGSSIIAEMLRLADHIPLVFAEPGTPYFDSLSANEAVDPKAAEILVGFEFLERPEFFEERIERSKLATLDDSLRTQHLEVLKRFYQLFESLVRYTRQVESYISDVKSGVYMPYTIEEVLMDDDGKQLLSEAIYLCGVMLLLMDRRIPGFSRERMIVAYFRWRGGGSVKNLDEVTGLCRSTGFSLIPGSRRPPNYPEVLFRRVELNEAVVKRAVGRLTADDLYKQARIYPNTEHRSFAYSAQSSMLYVLLYFVPDMLKNEMASMREIVDKYFGDNWIISVYMGFTVDLQQWWEPYRAAKHALSNVVDTVIVTDLTRVYGERASEIRMALATYLSDGVLVPDFVLSKLPRLMHTAREANTVLRWLLLHRTTSDIRLVDIVARSCSSDDVLMLLLETAQFELKLKGIVEGLVTGRAAALLEVRTEIKERLLELADCFSGKRALSRVKADASLEKWFVKLEARIAKIDYEKPLDASRKLVLVLSALDDVVKFHQFETSVEIKLFLSDTKAFIDKMIRILELKDSTVGHLGMIGEFSYGWQIIQQEPYSSLMQNKIQEDPNTCLLLRSTFLKLVSILDLPLVRITQCSSPDIVSVAAYYSTQLVGFIRTVLEIIPRSIFGVLNTIIDIQTNHLKPMPMKIQRGELADLAQLEPRYALAKATHQVSVFTEGILRMDTTFVGIISVEPTDLLEKGIRRELVRQVSSALHSILVFPAKFKPTARVLEEKLSQLATRLSGFRTSFEYIQDYLNLYGLRVWQEEILRIICFNVEQEVNPFLKRKIKPYESMYQNDTAPVDVFLKTPGQLDSLSVNFMGRLVRQLLVHTDVSEMIHIPWRQAWYHGGTEIVGIRTFSLLNQSIGVFGLAGVDSLIGFMLVKDLKKFIAHYRKFVLDTEIAVLIVNDLAKDLFPLNQIPGNPVKTYGPSFTKVKNLADKGFAHMLAKVGQKQLLRSQIAKELNISSRLDSKLLFYSLEALNEALKQDILRNVGQPEDAPGFPNTTLLTELSRFLDGAGMSNPFQKIYVTVDPLPGLTTFLFLLTLTQLPNLQWPSRYDPNTKPVKDVLDGTCFVIGVITLLKQVHQQHALDLFALLGQYFRSVVSVVVSASPAPRELSQDCCDVLFFLEKLRDYGDFPRDVIDDYVPQYLFDRFQQWNPINKT